MAKAINHLGQLIDTPSVDPSVVSAAEARADARRAVQAWKEYQAKAQAELNATDHWAMPDYDKTFTDERKAYRAALRAIVRASTGDASQPFPAKPA